MKKFVLCVILLFICLQAISQDIQNAEQKQIDFFERRMNQQDLKGILSDQEKKTILHSFLELGKISPEKGNGTLFRIAVAQNIYDTTKLYHIFENEFDSILAIKYQAAAERYQAQHSVSDRQMQFIAPSLYQQTREFRFNYYLSPDNEMERARLDNVVRDKYDPMLKFGRYSQRLDLVDLNDELYKSIMDNFVAYKKQYPEKTNKEVFSGNRLLDND